MFKNYLKIALRTAMKQKGYSFINVAGLSLGMACTILVLLWVRDELSYDRFHEHADTLYRVEEDQHYSGRIFHVTVTPHPAAPVFEQEIPEIARAVRFSWRARFRVRHENKVFMEDKIHAVDPAFLKMFSFGMLAGDPETALIQPNSILLTESIARKYFGEENPIGKILTLGNDMSRVITGVLADVPSNSTLDFNMLVPWTFMDQMKWSNEYWGSNSIVTYVRVPDAGSVAAVNRKMTEIVHSHNEDSVTDFVLMPLTDVHLHAHFGYGRGVGAVQYVYIFSFVALFVLLLACINFMNLSTARSANRAREIGVRKAAGALRLSIGWQFILESVFMAVASLLLAFVLVLTLLPVFNTISGKEISADILAQPGVLFGLVVVTLVTGLVSGSYPALFLSGFNPVEVLKGSLGAGAKSSGLRRFLVVLQFGLSIMLIIGTVVVYEQLEYMRGKDFGYEKDHLLYIRMADERVSDSYTILKERLLQHPEILSVSAAQQAPPIIGNSSSGAKWQGKDAEQEVLISHLRVDYGYTTTLGIEMLQGRSFDSAFTSDRGTDSTGNFIVNEVLADIIGLDPIVGADLEFMGLRGQIVGVMKNFHFASVRRNIGPLALAVGAPDDMNVLLIRARAEDAVASVSAVRDAWARTVPDYPLELKFVDQEVGRLYRAEQRMGDILKYFTVLAVCISCLGLFGLAAFMSEQRTKEIGVRKVLGASIPSIVSLLSTEFARWVIIANLIAWPAAYFGMHKWLQGFAYRVDLSWTVFWAAGISTLVIAMFTVSSQAIKSAVINPAKALRYE